MIIDLEAREPTILWQWDSLVSRELHFDFKKKIFKNDSQMHFNGLKRITILKVEVLKVEAARECVQIHAS